MLSVAPFRALRFRLERVDLGALLASAAHDDAPRDPRNAAALVDVRDTAPGSHRRAALQLAELVRAGVVARDAQRSLTILRSQTTTSQTTSVWGAVRAAGEGALTVDAAAHEAIAARLRALRTCVAPLVVRALDPGARISRLVSTELEREPDASPVVDGAAVGAWIVDDESTCARLCAALAQAPIRIQSGQAAWASLASYVSNLEGAHGSGLVAFTLEDDASAQGMLLGAAMLPLIGAL